MATRFNILSVGNHPNLAFYNWRLFNSKTCDLTLVNSNSSSSKNELNNSFQWSSKQFGNSRYTLSNIYDDFDDYSKVMLGENSAVSKIDFIFVSATSLQELSTFFLKLAKLIKAQLSIDNTPAIIIESTTFVNLEPFIKMSLQLDTDIPILSIMSDYDIRLIGNNNYQVYESKKESDLLYIGRSGTDQEYAATDITLINKISDLFESAGIDVYKLSTPVEFLSYQWKFALPKIAVEPLSILFEKPFPDQLQEQILAKPLISGLILEVITVIKTMGCKLFKSYDSETSLLERLCQLYPPVQLSDDFKEAPRLFYDFYNQNELYLDLLLLQPILIADDFQVKTPYLEFLYAMITQFNSNNLSNLSNTNSVFWLRKNSENVRELKLNQDSLAIQNALKEKELKQAKAKLDRPEPAPSHVAPPPMPNSSSIPNGFSSQSNYQTSPSQPPQVVQSNSYNQIYQQQQHQPQPRDIQMQPPQQHQQPQYQRNGSAPIHQPHQSLDNDLEELSQVAHAYVLAEQTPPVSNGPQLQQGYQPKPVPNIYSQQQPVQQPPVQQYANQGQRSSPKYDQYGNAIPSYPQHQNNNGTSSPSYIATQSLPHGLPPQGLPSHQPIFQQKFQGQGQQPPMGLRHPSMPTTYTHDNEAMINGSNGRTYTMQSSYDQSNQPMADTSYGSMPGGGNRQFKPTSRKNRKSGAGALSLQLGASGPSETRGMPSRHSMMPSLSQPPNVMQQPYPLRQSSSTGLVNMMSNVNTAGVGPNGNGKRPSTSNGLGINGGGGGPYGVTAQSGQYNGNVGQHQPPSNFYSSQTQLPQPQQQKQQQQQQQEQAEQSFPLMQGMQGMQGMQKPPPNKQQQQQPQLESDIHDQPELGQQQHQTLSPQQQQSQSGSSRSNDSIPGGATEGNGMVAVPEATPAPTPAYVVPVAAEKEKKKKRGLFGRKK